MPKISRTPSQSQRNTPQDPWSYPRELADRKKSKQQQELSVSELNAWDSYLFEKHPNNAIRLMKRKNIDPNATAVDSQLKRRYPILTMAVMSYHTKLIEALLTKGANPNQKVFPDDTTPLEYMLDNYQETALENNIIELLLKHGANTSHFDDDEAKIIEDIYNKKN